MHLLLTLFFALSLTPSSHATWLHPGRVAPKQARTEVQKGKAVVIDVREAKERESGMVDGAKTFPFSKLNTPEWDEFVKTLPKDKKIYTYCAAGGRADKVAQKLRREGFKANSTGGYPDWKKLN